MINNEKTVKKTLFILLGICISVIGAMLWANGGYEKGGLLQLGRVYHVPREVLNISSETVIYEPEQERYFVQQEAGELYIRVSPETGKWKYCTVKLDKLNVVPMNWEVELLDSEWNSLHKKQYTVRSGTNNLKISAKGDVQCIRVGIYNQQGYTFRIKDITLRQRFFDMEDFLEKTAVLMLLCVVFYILKRACTRLDWYFIIEVLQGFYIWFGNRWGEKTASVFSGKVRKRLQVFCFMLVFLLMPVMNVVNGADYYAMTPGWLCVSGILLMVAGLLSWKKPLQELEWKNGMCLTWLVLWTGISLSDLLVIKSFSYAGHIMVICAGFAFFIWNNELCFQRVMHNMIKALEGTLWIILLYCVIFRQKKTGVFYNGCFLSHESMAMYMLAVLVAFLAELNFLVRREQLSYIKILVCGVGAAVSSLLLYYSRTPACMLAAVLAIFIWGIRQLLNLRKYAGRILQLILLTGMVLVCGAGAAKGVKYLVETLPQKLGTNTVYANEIQESMVPLELMNALEAEQPGWIEGVSEPEEGEQRNIWSMYIQKWNLIGNKDNLRIEEKYVNPANGIIQMAYRYGVPVLVPYMMMMILYVFYIIREKRCLWLLIGSTFLAVQLLGNVEMPFMQPLWLMFYMGIGSLLGNVKKNNVRLESAND